MLLTPLAWSVVTIANPSSTNPVAGGVADVGGGGFGGRADSGRSAAQGGPGPGGRGGFGDRAAGRARRAVSAAHRRRAWSAGRRGRGRRTSLWAAGWRSVVAAPSGAAQTPTADRVPSGPPDGRSGYLAATFGAQSAAGSHRRVGWRLVPADRRLQWRRSGADARSLRAARRRRDPAIRHHVGSGFGGGRGLAALRSGTSAQILAVGAAELHAAERFPGVVALRLRGHDGRRERPRLDGRRLSGSRRGAQGRAGPAHDVDLDVVALPHESHERAVRDLRVEAVRRDERLVGEELASTAGADCARIPTSRPAPPRRRGCSSRRDRTSSRRRACRRSPGSPATRRAARAGRGPLR